MEENSPSPADSESIASGEQFEMREWTDNTGQYRVRAKLVDLSDDHVQLLKENGTLSNVPIKRLSETDQRYISEIRASY